MYAFAVTGVNGQFPFNGGNPFQGGPFDPNFGPNLARQIQSSVQSSLNTAFSQGSNMRGTSMISSSGGGMITTTIGGRTYTARIPSASSVSTQSSITNNNGQMQERVVVTINGDTTVYTTVNGHTTVTDGQGNPRPDGGPFHIGTQQRFN
ncbi:unnamed protein product [Cylicocyclus nassatus]|uniref:Uncharacterized protein n=1 Tax=Cylicocyclus nassatus TaxID=53992 RepID=A0AA36H5G3_CYLNA|nr:unnamed protein product [Cylicocyclus nassatus]